MKPSGHAAPDAGQRTNHAATTGRSAIGIAPGGRCAGRLRRPTRRDAAFVLILLLAAFMRSIGLNRGLWLDEIANVGVLTRPAIAALFDLEITTGRSPLFFALYRPWLALAGDSAVAARWPALLAGVLGVALIWRVGRAWVGPRAGSAATLLLALNPLHIWYSQEASFYTLVSALALGVVRLSSPPAPLLSARRRGEGGEAWAGKPGGRWLLLAFGLALLLAASPWTIFFVAALGSWVLIWRRAQRRFFLTALLLALLLSAPALAIYLRGAAAGWSTPTTRPGLPLAQVAYALLTLGWGFAAGPPPEALRQALATGAGLRTLLQAHSGWLVLAASSWLLLAASPWLIPPRRAWLSRFSTSPLRSPSPSPAPRSPISVLRSPLSNLRSPICNLHPLLLLWLTIPLLGANLLAWWVQTNFNVRYVLFVLPALLLWLAGQNRGVVGLAVILSVLFWFRGVSDPTFAQEDLQQPAQFLQSAVQPADVLLLRAPEVYLLAPLAFYGAPNSAIAWYNGDAAQRQAPAAFVAQETAGHCRIWLWSARAWLVDRDDALSASLAAFATPVITWRWPGSALTLFERAPCS